jgi:hypothetical protein
MEQHPSQKIFVIKSLFYSTSPVSLQAEKLFQVSSHAIQIEHSTKNKQCNFVLPFFKHFSRRERPAGAIEIHIKQHEFQQ